MKTQDVLKAQLLALPKGTALRVIADVLREYGTRQASYAVAIAPGSGTLEFWEAEHGPARETLDVRLLALPDQTALGFMPGGIEEGCDYGECSRCRALLQCSHKYVLCPVCGTEAYLT
jgi:hypothetical protein